VAAPRALQYVPDAGGDSAASDVLPAGVPVVSGAAPRPEELWQYVFGNDAAVEIEIGCGKGTFLLEAAHRFRGRNFLGLERAPRLARHAERAATEAGLPNLRILCCDAGWVITRLLPARSVAAYHLYFPDPWWKRRHHKRRLYTVRFAAAIARTLVPGGRVSVATDVGPLLDLIGERFARAGLGALAASPALPQTTFARRCAEADRPLHRATFVLDDAVTALAAT
jgi:tRNA (guanine-N7-)-methyltransferase